MRSAAQKSTGSLGALCSRLLKIPIILRAILRGVYSAIPHNYISNLCHVPYTYVRTYVGMYLYAPATWEKGFCVHICTVLIGICWFLSVRHVVDSFSSRRGNEPLLFRSVLTLVFVLC